MIRAASALVLILSLAGLALAEDSKAAGELSLKYAVTAHGDAQAPVLASPGHSGQYALRFSSSLRSWARWNFPIFEPVPQLEKITFWAKGSEDHAAALAVRLLEQDGSEWQSRALDLTSDWKMFELGSADFKYFRSRPSRNDTSLSMPSVMQVHFATTGGHKGGIEFLLDDIRLDPGGPCYGFEQDEMEKPMSPEQIAEARYAFLRSVNEAMLQQIDAEVEYVRQNISDVELLLKAKKPEEVFDDLFHKYQEQVTKGAFAFQKQPPAFDHYVSIPTKGDSSSQLNTAALQFKTHPCSLCRFQEGDLTRWRSSKLYSAANPPPPAWRKDEAGNGLIEQHVVFSSADSRQVVFLRLELDDLIDMRERYDTIAFQYRITSNKINPKEGVQLRFFSDAPHESWTGCVAIKPDDIAIGEWTECKLSLSAFSTGVRFDPSRLQAVAFRIENQPGEGAEFNFSVSSLQLRCERPYELAMSKLQEQGREEITNRRMELLRLYDELLTLKRKMGPELLRFYLCSQLASPARWEEPALHKASDALVNATPEKSHGALTVIVKAEALPEQAAGRLDTVIRYRGGPPLPSRIEVGLFDHLGRCVYANVLDNVRERATKDSLHVAATIPGLHYWWPGYPYLYQIKVCAFDGNELVDVFVKKIGFAKVECRQGDLTGAMRHARGLSARDYSVWINGQPYFPIGTHAGLGGMENPRDFTSLLHDLWLEFQRNYGFSPGADLWDIFDEEGLMYTCPIHPRYSAISSYRQVERFLREYELQIGMSAADLHHPSILHYAIGNEAELPIWGADLAAVFGKEIWEPIERAARIVKASVGDGAPVCYIRAGSFNRVPGIPSEDMSGVNQYTGRYGGRIEQIPRALRILTLNSALRGWPVMITEWNGPKYTWATTGIGGSSEHGCAYYIHKYWDSLVRTNAIVGSSEFTLNWVVTPIEDLTTVSIEEGMKRRPKYSPFGGGHTADHVPYMWPNNIVECDTYRYMQAFQSPLYFFFNAPGKLVILHVPAAEEAAKEIAAILNDLGKEIEIKTLLPEHDLAKMDANILLLGGVGAEQPRQIKDLESRMVIGETMDGFPPPDMPMIQKRVNPYYPQRALVVVTASGGSGYNIGVERLLESAHGLRRIHREESAMTRLLIFADEGGEKVYQYYFNEFAARGYFYGIDDFRTEIRREEFLDANSQLLERFWNLTAVVLDLNRGLSADELDTLKAVSKVGVNIVVSLPCYEKNPPLHELFGATIGKSSSLTDSIRVEEEFQKPLKVPELGDVRLDRIAKYLNMTEAECRERLQIRQLAGEDVAPVAKMRNGGQPVAVMVSRSGGRWFLVGCGLRELFETHTLVTRRGETHPLYDRGTACGLERLSRLVVNMCRTSAAEERDLHFLRGTVESAAALLPKGESVRVWLKLTDEKDQPVSGATVLATVHRVSNRLGSSGKSSIGCFTIRESESGKGIYGISVALADEKHPPSEPGVEPQTEIYLSRGEEADRLGEAAICVEVKAIKRGYLLYEDAICLFVER